MTFTVWMNFTAEAGLRMSNGPLSLVYEHSELLTLISPESYSLRFLFDKYNRHRVVAADRHRAVVMDRHRVVIVDRYRTGSFSASEGGRATVLVSRSGYGYICCVATSIL